MENRELTVNEKAAALFRYIRELSSIRQNAVYDAADYDLCRYLGDLPSFKDSVEIRYRDRVQDDTQETDAGSAVLTVRKPELEAAPEPDGVFSDLLKEGWQSYKNAAETYDVFPDDLSDTPERFGDLPDRVTAYGKWSEKRSVWAARQKEIDSVRSLFTELYQLHARLERESESLEMVISNGFVRVASNPAVCHPLLTKRVRTVFDAGSNSVSIEDTDAETVLETTILHALGAVNLDRVPELRADLSENGYHPLDRNDTPEFLKRLAHTLTPESVFSGEGLTPGWESRGKLAVYIAPALIVRRRVSGASGMTARVIENIENTGYLPDHIADIVRGGVSSEAPDMQDREPDSVDRLLADASGEDRDIFLSKEANREQLEIARRIEKYSAVLVQGPPGTGKTHTIANLTGHFLAQGKTVLITSHTKKALSVLKDKLPEGMRSLCVSVLDDTNSDMEKSVDGITDCMSKYTSHDLENIASSVAAERLDIIAGQAETRRRLFSIICSENEPIELSGEKISPAEAAKFVASGAEYDFIPPPVRLYSPLPLGYERLAELYRTNAELSSEDEPELECGLPSPSELPEPSGFDALTADLAEQRAALAETLDALGWEADRLGTGDIMIVTPRRSCRVSSPTKEALAALSERLAGFETVSSWMRSAASDGRQGGASRARWTVLTAQIEKTHALSERVTLGLFGHNIAFSRDIPMTEIPVLISKLRDHLDKKGKVSKLDLMLSGDLRQAISAASVDGRQPQSADDCRLILDKLELDRETSVCEGYWNGLMNEGGAPAFRELDPQSPINAAARWKSAILRWLDWFDTDIAELSALLSAAGFDPGQFLSLDPLDPIPAATDKLISAIRTELPSAVNICSMSLSISETEEMLKAAEDVLRSGKRAASPLCLSMLGAIEARDGDEYRRLYARMAALYTKYDVQTRRAALLAELASVAPKWADAVRERSGVHGGTAVPPHIDEAWRYRQLSGILENAVKTPLGPLLKKNASLSRRYRELTSEYAEKSAWKSLISRTELDIGMRQALQGWKQTVKKIGKGTGKNAARLRAEARRLISRCQQAVPAWIMPVSRVMESLDPAVNRFDILIIDEASQSDISALSVLYMAKKVIIVGDDRQVSPMAVGVETETLNNLAQMYINGVIPNSQLYDAKTSLYDIAATTFQPLMLREHFRCVPRIIGFSNMLSYDGRIMPLRDSGSCSLLPSVADIRVEGGGRDGRGKTNPAEARRIVSLLRACLEAPEYKGSTFGVISLLGDDQAKLIDRMIYETVDIRDIDSRRILCGNASDFQGDERDVIFLSVVDSPDGDGQNGPLKLMGFGPDDAYRKRYNVAASRAKDQLFVISSLDPATDLKSGDIRKTLLDYAADPDAFIPGSAASGKATELEREISSRLTEMGYKVENGRRVGGYRLDMTVVSDAAPVAVECTGAAELTGADAVRYESRLDMERQTILERTGWRFIRVRASEYYLDPDGVTERIKGELSACGVLPGGTDDRRDEGESLLARITARAAEIEAEGREAEEEAAAAPSDMIQTKSIF